MTVGLIYDLKENFIALDDNTYCDFSTQSEVEHVKSALRESGYLVLDIGSTQNFLKLLSKGGYKLDVIFNMVEGYKSRNREGIVPAICEAYGIKYAGTDSFGLSLTLHKYQTNLIVKDLNILVPSSFIVEDDIFDFDDLRAIMNKRGIGFPLILKPNHEGSSMGITLVNNVFELKSSIKDLIKIYSQEILCQEFIKGEEASVPMIKNKNNVEILGIVSFGNKEGDNLGVFTNYIKNNNLYIQRSPHQNEKMLNRIKNDSIRIFKALKLKSYCRMDWIIKDDQPFFLEATPLPSFEKGNCFEWCAEKKGAKFSDVLKKIIDNIEE